MATGADENRDHLTSKERGGGETEALWSRDTRRSPGSMEGSVQACTYEFAVTPVFLAPRVPPAMISYLGACTGFSER